MSRRMSCSLTIGAVRARTKTVTRRHPDTWGNLAAGDRLIPADVRVLSLWQPYATLWADPELPKTIETRPKAWPSTIPLPAWVLIHAAAKVPEPWSMIGGYRVQPRTSGWWLDVWGRVDGAGLPIRHGLLPLGAVIGAAHVTDCLPMADYMTEREDVRRRIEQIEHTLWIRTPGVVPATNITADLPYGDYTPGRFGYLTDRTLLLPEPIAWKGAQGFQRVTPELVAAVNAQIGAIP